MLAYTCVSGAIYVMDDYFVMHTEVFAQHGQGWEGTCWLRWPAAAQSCPPGQEGFERKQRVAAGSKRAQWKHVHKFMTD